MATVIIVGKERVMRRVFEQQFTPMVVYVTLLVVLLAAYAIDPSFDY